MALTRREQIAAHEETLHMLWRRAHRLQLYVAQYGSAAEPGHVLELEDVEAQLTQLQQTLMQLRNVTPDAQPPYLGLKTFDEAHARFFYGREALIDTLVERVNHTAFMMVIGPSGSGKSSVVRAGLIPALKQGLDLAGSDQWIYVPPFPPGPRPMNALAAALTALPNSCGSGLLSLSKSGSSSLTVCSFVWINCWWNALVRGWRWWSTRLRNCGRSRRPTKY